MMMTMDIMMMMKIMMEMMMMEMMMMMKIMMEMMMMMLCTNDVDDILTNSLSSNFPSTFEEENETSTAIP